MNSPAEGKERRLVIRILDYWREKAAGHRFPGLGDIEPAEIPDMWPHVFVLDVRNRENPVFHLVGQFFIDRLGDDPKGEGIAAAARDRLLAASLGPMDVVLRRGVPYSEGKEIPIDSETKYLYRTILLPLSDDGERIDYLLGATNGKLAPVHERSVVTG